MSFLDFPGLQYFYNKYLKPIKPHAREETIKSYTVNEQGHVPDAQLVVQLKEENESLQEEIEKLNSALSRIIVTDITNATFKYNNEDNINRFEIVYGLQDGCIALLWWDGVNIAYDFYDGTKWNRIWTK